MPPAAPAGSLTITAGYDLFETEPGATQFNLSIPADFFGPGSDPVNSVVQFAGEPLGTFMGNPAGDADTVVHRLAPAAPNPGPVAVPIEIVALNLVSIQPIMVTYGSGAPELWDVRATLDQTQTQGQMQITATSSNGGTFDSTLPVVPVMTFTNLGNGQTQTMSGIPQQTFQATSVPWTTGCQLPALHVPGLNDGFCPSFDGQKVLTLETASLAQHGIYPAQPMLEHFECYVLEGEPFATRQVQLTDQFGTRNADIVKRNELCNPVKKRQELFQNKLAHQVCYATAGNDVGAQVAVRNQFGSQRLLVHNARRLCVPSDKRELGKPWQPTQVPIDHYQCYSVDALTGLQRYGPIGKIRLRDQFGREAVRLGAVKQLCAPVAKVYNSITTPIQHPVKHLVCYQIRDERKEIGVQIRNQFEKRKLETKRPVLLCVPSDKVPLD
jgi:hypothetical protein